MKCVAAFFKSSHYGDELEAKMRDIGKCSSCIDDQADLKQHERLQEVQSITRRSRFLYYSQILQLTRFAASTQLENVEECTTELKSLATEARNHLYALLSDTEVLQEAIKRMYHSAVDK